MFLEEHVTKLKEVIQEKNENNSIFVSRDMFRLSNRRLVKIFCFSISNIGRNLVREPSISIIFFGEATSGILYVWINCLILFLRYLNSQYNEKNSFNAWMDVTPYSFGSEFQERQLDIGPVREKRNQIRLINIIINYFFLSWH